ncbi:MAG: diacylglycerol kinase family protein, partial [Bacteroidota bacterium]
METSEKRWHFLVNPAAGRGRAARQWRRWLPLLEAALPGMSWAESSAQTGMAALAEAAVRSGKHNLVGVGGDGTHHDILNGIIAADGLGQVVYAPLPLGSGNDWVRTLDTPRKPADWVAMLRAGRILRHGVGRLWYGTQTRYFLNVAGMAYDALVLRKAEASWFKHRLLYPFMTLWFLREFTAPSV